MNILVVSPFLPYPTDNGGAMRIYHLTKHLAGRHRVVLLCYGVLTEEAAQALSFCEAVETVPPPRFPRSWWEHLGGLLSGKPASVCFPVDPLAGRMRSLLRRYRFDVVRVEFLGIAHVVQALGDEPRRILVNHLITSESRSRQLRLMPWGLKRLYYGLDLLKLRRYERLALWMYDACTAVSARDARQIAAWMPGLPVAAVPNGVDTDHFRPGGAEDAKSLVFVGAFDREEANVDGAVYFARRVLPLIRRRVPDVRLTVVGGHPPACVRDLRSLPGVEVTGWVEDIRPYVDRAAVMVLPLRGGAGTKIRIYTAMAMQKAIVATSRAAEGIDVVPDDDIVLADDPERFADAVVSLVHDAQRRERIGRAARARAVAEFDWRSASRRLEAFLQTVAGGAESKETAPAALFLGFGDVLRSLGARVYLSSLLDALRSSGRSVQALFLQQAFPDSSETWNAEGSLVTVRSPMDLAARVLPRWMWRSLEFAWANWRGLNVAFARRLRCKVCLVTGAGLLPLLPVLRRWYTTVAYVQHGIAEELQLSAGPAERARYRLFKALERRFMPLADFVITVSNRMAEYCRSEYGVGLCLIVPCCVDPALFSHTPADRAVMRRDLGLQNRLVLVYSGGAAAWQCVAQTVRLFQAVRSALPHAFLLVLSGDTAAWHDALRGVDPETHRVLKVPHAAVGRYLCAADAALLLRRKSVINAVASPVKFAEYLSSGLPIITSPFVGDYSAMVRNRNVGLLIDPDDESTWPAAVAALSRMTQDPDVGARCRDAARSLRWDAAVEPLSSALAHAHRLGRPAPAVRRVDQHAH